MTERRLPQTAVENLVEDLASKANADLSNLDATGQAKFDAKANIALTNSPYATNRILEIPQNLQISVNGDTITISGKATRLNGDLVNINVSRTFTGTVGKTYVLISAQPYSSMNTWTFSENNSLASYQQDSQPTITTAYAFWFDTANNRLMFTSNTGSSWYEVVLPFGVAHYTSNGWVIDQVFNGFGYIGSTVFALPGVKYEFPNGFNEDGSYKSTFYTSNKVSVLPIVLSRSHSLGLIMFDNGSISYADLLEYNPKTNYNRYDGTTDYLGGIFGRVYTIDTKVQRAVFSQVDSVANSNASNFSQAGRSYLSGLGMPSGRYIDLTLGASGSMYTAPANGYLFLSKTATAVGQYIALLKSYYQEGATAGVSSETLRRGIQVLKGESVTVSYSVAGSTNYFRFIYAEGEN